MPEFDALVVSCEHASNAVPQRHRERFLGMADLLNSHRGYDPGAIALARQVAKQFQAPLFATAVTRLLVEPNRSIGHLALFSPVTRNLPDAQRKAILDQYYYPHRNRVEAAIASRIAGGGTVLHLSIHTFAPELDGVIRPADVGLLYDPSQAHERSLCCAWQRAFRETYPALRVRRNYPYRGAADGFTTWLRRRFPGPQYAGIELEASQALAAGERSARRQLCEAVLTTLDASLPLLGRGRLQQ